MKHSPLISVIIPTYNRLEYFKVALRSVLRQSYNNFEVILTDDSTNDEIRKYVCSLQSSSIKYFKNAIRLGIAHNIRSGIEKSNGEYFAFLNDDDCWSPNFLKDMVDPLSNDAKISLVFCDHWLINGRGNILREQTRDNSKLYCRTHYSTGYVDKRSYNRLFADFTVPVAMGCLLKKSAFNLNDYPDSVGPAYDRWILMQYVSQKAMRIYYVGKRLTFYRIHEGSTTARNRADVVRAVIFILKTALNRIQMTLEEMALIKKEIRDNYRLLLKLSVIKAQVLPAIRYGLLYGSCILGLLKTVNRPGRKTDRKNHAWAGHAFTK